MTPTLTTPRPPHSKLTQVQVAQLFQHLDRDKEATRATTATALAVTATEELGFQVSATNIAHLRRGMGLSPRPEKKVEPSPEQSAIGTLARVLLAMQAELGTPPSAELQALAA